MDEAILKSKSLRRISTIFAFSISLIAITNLTQNNSQVYSSGSNNITSSKILDQSGNHSNSVRSSTLLLNHTAFDNEKKRYLSAWNRTDFHSEFNIFVNNASGYAVYQEHESNIFKPGETLLLYVEPVGFSYKPVIDEKGHTLYQINFTSSITLTNHDGKELAAVKDIPVTLIISHHKVTEVFLLLRLTQDTPLPEGSYNVTFVVKDGTSGKSFMITKNIRIANTVKSHIA